MLSCSSDETENNDFVIEVLSNTPDSAVYVSGNSLEGKYIKSHYKEKITLGKTEYRFSARCDDEKTLITIKLYNYRGKLINEESGNKVITIVGKR